MTLNTLTGDDARTGTPVAALSTCTRDHVEIREWVTEHGGLPCRLRATPLIRDFLRIDFAGGTCAELEYIGWDEWLRLFDATESALVYGACSPPSSKKVFALVVPAPDFGN